VPSNLAPLPTGRTYATKVYAPKKSQGSDKAAGSQKEEQRGRDRCKNDEEGDAGSNDSPTAFSAVGGDDGGGGRRRRPHSRGARCSGDTSRARPTSSTCGTYDREPDRGTKTIGDAAEKNAYAADYITKVNDAVKTLFKTGFDELNFEAKRTESSLAKWLRLRPNGGDAKTKNANAANAASEPSATDGAANGPGN
jgi:hypothetical protein